MMKFDTQSLSTRIRDAALIFNQKLNPKWILGFQKFTLKWMDHFTREDIEKIPETQFKDILRTFNDIQNFELKTYSDLEDVINQSIEIMYYQADFIFKFVEIFHQLTSDRTQLTILKSETIEDLNPIFDEVLYLELIENRSPHYESKLNLNPEKLKLNVIEKRNFITSNPIKQVDSDSSSHSHIFCNNGFELFQILKKSLIRPKLERGHDADVIYCYHKLRNIDNEPKYIHHNITFFFEWYNRFYDEDISQSRTFNQVRTDSRDRIYKTLLTSFKLKT